MKKQISEHAAAAKQCRAFVKSLGLTGSATSDSYSMGSSIRIRATDANLEQQKQIREFCAQYQYGHFDGMQDLYESNNRRDDIPQVKHVFTEFDFSDAIKQSAYEWARAQLNYEGDSLDLPALYSEVKHYQRLGGEFASTTVYRVLNGSAYGYAGENKTTFWDTFTTPAPESVTPSPEITAGGITKIFHTKLQKDIFIVSLASQVERATYDALLGKAKGLGGWYSRAWGDSPAGFAFKDAATAQTFAGGTPSATSTVATPSTVADSTRAHKLRALAAICRKESDAKLTNRETNTQKRLAQAMHARIEGLRLDRAAIVAEKLADMWDSGTIPATLKVFNSKKSLVDALHAKTEPRANGFHSFYVETGEPHDGANLELWALLSAASDPVALKIQDLEIKVKFANIAGYFPTPAPVSEHIKNAVGFIQDGARVLEPSAGRGNLCEFIRDEFNGALIKAFEINHDLATLCELKGFDCAHVDFMTLEPLSIYDYVIMNPPFESLQDCAHVRRAFDWLTNGGQLVAIMSPSFTFNGSSKALEFRKWAANVGATWQELPAGSFKESGTGVNTVLFSVTKQRKN